MVSSENESKSYQYGLMKLLRDSLWAYRSRGDSAVFTVAFRSLFNSPYPQGSPEEHLNVTMDWLCAAQDATTDDGVSAFYDARKGEWAPSYPETTGYIIPTFFDFAAFSGNEIYRTRAIRMANWLLSLQMECGAFPIGPLWPDWEIQPVVFDTGQIIQGLVRCYEETKQLPYLDAAKRAGDWLLEIQDRDGCWRKHTTKGIEHAYNVRVAWALIYLGEVSGEEKYRLAGHHNITWTISQQMEDGWIKQMGFRSTEDPLTHTIAYTIEGLLESGILLDDQKIIATARKAADVLLDIQKKDGYLRARYGPGWISNVSWSCPTGTAQMAAIWFRLYEITKADAYILAAIAANDYVKKIQNRNAKLPGIKGGIPGSFPVYQEYEPYRYLNWAAKFFSDSLLKEYYLKERGKL